MFDNSSYYSRIELGMLRNSQGTLIIAKVFNM